MGNERISLAVEQVEGAASLDPVLSPRLWEEHRARVRSIHELFTAERQQAEQDQGAQLRERWRFWTVSHRFADGYREVMRLAETLRGVAEAVVVVGIGGSDLAARVIHDVLDDPYHNLHCRRGQPPPQLFFAGHTFDPRALNALLDVLGDRLERTALIVVSRSGTTAETSIAMRCLAERLGADWRRRCVVITRQDEQSTLFRLQDEMLGHLPVQVGVGGRFSGHTEVGLLPALVAAPAEPGSLGRRLEAALAGIRAADELLCLDPQEARNVAFRLASWLYLGEVYGRRGTVVFYNFADMRSLGDWMVQLVSESLQERGRGLNIIPATGPTANHSLANGIVRGPRDKAVLFVRWRDLGEDREVPDVAGLEATLEGLQVRSLARIQEACYVATARDFAENGVPSLTLALGRRDTSHLFALLRVLMDTVAVLGKLLDLDRDEHGAIHPEQELTYLQHGVEGYKQKTREELARG